jgi:hypothetical protein
VDSFDNPSTFTDKPAGDGLTVELLDWAIETLQIPTHKTKHLPITGKDNKEINALVFTDVLGDKNLVVSEKVWNVLKESDQKHMFNFIEGKHDEL